MSKNTTGTAAEQEIHKTAVRLRRMTDAQLVSAFNATRNTQNASAEGGQGKDKGNLNKLLKMLADGECKGIKSGNAYKIIEFAREKGFI